MDFRYDPSLVLYLPLWKRDGASFISDDAYGHTVTVTGALWGLNGRDFDKIDNLINCGSAPSIDNIFDGGGTVIAWIKPDSGGENDHGIIFDKMGGSAGCNYYLTGEAAGKSKLRVFTFWSGNNGYWTTDNTVITFGDFAFVALTYNIDATANNPIFYVNTTAYTVGDGLTENVAPTGTRSSDAANTLYVGNDAGTTYTFEGIIGEVWFFSRAFTPLEIQHNYLATKWRYL